jgi:catechol 2,3-dioxygenase-like lactoylglutathione lyase family enzyme
VPELHHAGLTVTDLERSLAFWRDALGMEVVLDQVRDDAYLGEVVGHPGADCRMVHLAFGGEGARVELFEYRAPRVEPAPVARPAQPGFAHVCVRADGLRELLERLEAAGGRRVSDPVEVTAGANRGALAVYVRDPDGHVVELVQP